jgi:hypothetical protein
MKIEFALDRAGLWWSGLGVSLHVAKDARAAGEPAVWWARQAPGSRSFRVGGLEGSVSRIARA